MIKQQKKLPKRKKKVHCLQNHFFLLFFGPMGLGETLAIFFSVIFPVSWILRDKNQLLIVSWWFAKKIFVNYFGGDRSSPKIDVSFDFGVLILDLGVLILDLGVLILDLGVLILDFGVLFWSFDFWGTVCTHLMFQNMRLGEQLQTPPTQPPGRV